MWRKGNLHALLVVMQIGAATVESSMELPQKFRMGLPNDPAIPLLAIYLKKPETVIQTIYAPLCSLQCYLQSPRFGSSPCSSVDEWIKKLWRIHTVEYYSAEFFFFTHSIPI